MHAKRQVGSKGKRGAALTAQGHTPLCEGYSATLDEIRDVWTLVSYKPLITSRCVAKLTGLGKTKAHHIMQFLQRAGYIKHRRDCIGRTAVIPLVCIEEKQWVEPTSRLLTESETERP